MYFYDVAIKYFVLYLLDGKPKGKKWWMELRRNRLLDMNAETNN